MLTTKCVGAVMLTETRDALHGGQIPETPNNWANQATSDPSLNARHGSDLSVVLDHVTVSGEHYCSHLESGSARQVLTHNGVFPLFRER
jgi:hypothetical protein